MIIPVTNIVQDADTVDLSDLTDAVRTGPATWTPGGLDIPFNRDLTDVEVQAVVLRLTSVDPAEELTRATLTDYLAVEAPTVEQMQAQIQALTNLLLSLVENRTP